jgi:hypothetical protein
MAEDIQCSRVSAIANGTMVVCWKPFTQPAPNHLMIHFHGAAETVQAAFARSDLNAVLVVINFPGLSSAYSGPFERDAELLPQILDDAKRAFQETASEVALSDWQRVSVSSFSAGYGAVRQILKSPKYFHRIDAIVAADSIYAGLQVNQPDRQVDEQNMRDFLRFASLAVENKKSFVISHSAQPTPYASTTETADYLLQQLRLVRQPDSSIRTSTLRQTTRASRGKFRVLGFAGESGPEHLQHLRNIELLWMPFNER